MSKRTLKDDATLSSDCAKKSRLLDEGPKFRVSSQEELDINILRFQNCKLSERLETRIKAESDLRQRIEQLEKKQTSTEAILFVVNRYWNQLNEDLRISLQRFDAEASQEDGEQRVDNEATSTFLSQLSNWDQEELEESLRQRVEVSTRAVAKILQAFDRLLQRSDKICSAINGGSENVDDSLKRTNVELMAENRRLNNVISSMHEKHHSLNLKFEEMKDKVEIVETLNEELKGRIDDFEYDLNRTRSKEVRLQEQLQEARERLRDADINGSASSSTSANGRSGGKDNLSQTKLEDIQKELEEQRELATNRMIELEQLNNAHKEALRTVKKLEMDLQCLPENVIYETVEYKCLQSHFSVLYNESMQLKTQLEETRNMISTAKTAHLRQIEHMESEELSMQKRLRTEVIQLEDQLAQVRKEYEMLRLEFEQNLAANEQTGPINREMRNLITSLQNHNQQLKGEIQRYKRRLKEANGELEKLKQDLEQTQAAAAQAVTVQNCVKIEPKTEQDNINEHLEQRQRLDFEPCHKETKEELKSTEENLSDLCSPSIKREDSYSGFDANKSPAFSVKLDDTLQNKYDKLLKKKAEQDNLIRDLKNQIKKISDQYKDVRLQLDGHKLASKDTREKAQLIANEKKYRLECDELRKQFQRVQQMPDGEKKLRRSASEDDTWREITRLKEEKEQLQKKLSLQKQEDEALLNEMEVTGSAFEDMQEQNLRLIQQLKEKDDANFKLMSERIKSQQIQKLLKEEKESLTEQIIALNSQVEAQNQVVRKLEEKERLLQNNLSTIEKELSLRQQSMEQHKRKAIESAQSAADLKLHLDKYLAQLKEAQSSVAEKSSIHQQEAFRTKRLHEELNSWKRKYERAKKFELAATADEVLLEEIREYKEQLTCPSCKVNRKDAVLTKCFHVFCFDCLKTRYDTRQRKCPKCNAAMGAHDFHRLYLA